MSGHGERDNEVLLTLIKVRHLRGPSPFYITTFPDTMQGARLRTTGRGVLGRRVEAPHSGGPPRVLRVLLSPIESDQRHPNRCSVGPKARCRCTIHDSPSSTQPVSLPLRLSQCIN